MHRNRQGVIIRAPKFLKQQFSLKPCVDEQQGGFVRLDLPVDISNCVKRGVAGPWQTLLGLQNADLWFCATGNLDQTSFLYFPVDALLRHQPGLQILWIGNGCRQANCGEVRGMAEHSRQTQGQKIAALGYHQRVQFIENHCFDLSEKPRCVFI